MRPNSTGMHRLWFLFKKVTQDPRLTLGGRSELLSIGLASQVVNTGEVIGQIDNPIYEVSPEAFRGAAYRLSSRTPTTQE